MSLSSRRAWIEIDDYNITRLDIACRSPHGERGLKFAEQANKALYCLSLSSRRAWIEIYQSATLSQQSFCRSPHGERGLKSTNTLLKIGNFKSRSPHGERGLKFGCIRFRHRSAVSLSSRRAWIEIKNLSIVPLKHPVALLTESVD